MKIYCASAPPIQTRVDILGIFIFAGLTSAKGAADFLPPSLKSEYLDHIERTQFNAAFKKTALLFTHHKIPSFLVAFIGLGSIKDTREIMLDHLRSASATLLHIAKQYRGKKIGLLLPPELSNVLDDELQGEALAEGAHLGSYRFLKHKSKPKKKSSDRDPQELVVFGKGKKFLHGLRRAY